LHCSKLRKILTALNNLKRIYLEEWDYEMSNMGFVLPGVGHSLERLKLLNIGIVLMAYIVTMYWFFKVLFLCRCTYV
jgi:preprotein translocase subunit SecF